MTHKCGHRLLPSEARDRGRAGFCHAPGQLVRMSRPGRTEEPQALCGAHVRFYRDRGWRVAPVLKEAACPR